jgi:hypothetical protein
MTDKSDLLALMERFDRLGRQLPAPEDITDPATRARAEAVMSEMRAVEKRIGALLLAVNRPKRERRTVQVGGRGRPRRRVLL